MELYNYRGRSIAPISDKYTLHRVQDFSDILSYMDDPNVKINYAKQSEKNLEKTKDKMLRKGISVSGLKDYALAKFDSVKSKHDVAKSFSEDEDSTGKSEDSGKSLAKKSLAIGLGVTGAAKVHDISKKVSTARGISDAVNSVNNGDSVNTAPSAEPQGKASDLSMFERLI